MYRALVAFNDLKDNNRSYDAGAKYPRDGLNVTEARLKELASNKNRMGFPLIEYVTEAAEKPVEYVVTEDNKIHEEKPKAARKPRRKRESDA